MTSLDPDPNRLGGIGWLERSRGELTKPEQGRLVRFILRGQAQLVHGRLQVLLGRRPDEVPNLRHLPSPPDSTLAKSAEAECLKLDPFLVQHSYRTWLYGWALATLDGVTIDPELSYVAALLHDVGLRAPTEAEDFTLRSAASAETVMADATARDVTAVRDAISVHTLPGATVARDGALGTYLQAGAMLDLVGMRYQDVPQHLIQAVSSRHPDRDLVPGISRLIRAEAQAVPNGRFALLNSWKLPLAVRHAPHR